MGNDISITDAIVMEVKIPVMKSIFKKKTSSKDLPPSVILWSATNHYSTRNSQKKSKRSTECRE